MLNLQLRKASPKRAKVIGSRDDGYGPAKPRRREAGRVGLGASPRVRRTCFVIKCSTSTQLDQPIGLPSHGICPCGYSFWICSILEISLAPSQTRVQVLVQNQLQRRYAVIRCSFVLSAERGSCIDTKVFQCISCLLFEKRSYSQNILNIKIANITTAGPLSCPQKK